MSKRPSWVISSHEVGLAWYRGEKEPISFKVPRPAQTRQLAYVYGQTHRGEIHREHL
jgi:hypothetical protein